MNKILNQRLIGNYFLKHFFMAGFIALFTLGYSVSSFAVRPLDMPAVRIPGDLPYLPPIIVPKPAYSIPPNFFNRFKTGQGISQLLQQAGWTQVSSEIAEQLSADQVVWVDGNFYIHSNHNDL